MRLIGMLDSPYVRRVAVSLRLLDVSFQHEPLSVFRDFGRFASINPVVKAPTLVTDDGLALLESTLILEVLDRSAPRQLRLMPEGEVEFITAQRLIGLALAACEKSIQIVYETNLRPVEKQHQPWLDRVSGQLGAALEALELGYADAKGWLLADRPMQVDVTSAVALSFIRSVLPDLAAEERYPSLSALARRAEALPEFLASPIA